MERWSLKRLLGARRNIDVKVARLLGTRDEIDVEINRRDLEAKKRKNGLTPAEFREVHQGCGELAEVLIGRVYVADHVGFSPNEDYAVYSRSYALKCMVHATVSSETRSSVY